MARPKFPSLTVGDAHSMRKFHTHLYVSYVGAKRRKRKKTREPCANLVVKPHHPDWKLPASTFHGGCTVRH